MIKCSWIETKMMHSDFVEIECSWGGPHPPHPPPPKMGWKLKLLFPDTPPARRVCKMVNAKHQYLHVQLKAAAVTQSVDSRCVGFHWIPPGNIHHERRLTSKHCKQQASQDSRNP